MSNPILCADSDDGACVEIVCREGSGFTCEIDKVTCLRKASLLARRTEHQVPAWLISRKKSCNSCELHWRRSKRKLTRKRNRSLTLLLVSNKTFFTYYESPPGPFSQDCWPNFRFISSHFIAKAKAEAAAAAAGDDSDDDAPRMNMGWSADDKEARPPTVSMARRMMSALGLSSKSTAEDVDRPRGSSLGM